jgi:uracil-DNA glycosylase family 4
MDTPIDLGETLNALHATLAQMGRWGCAGFECPPETLARLNRWGDSQRPDSIQDNPSERIAVPDAAEAGCAAGVQETLEQIRIDLGDCRRCGLAAGRTRIVFGAGDPKARLVFVGEGPGFEEDRQGLPFVGPAGQLLTKIITAMKLTRDQVYICNVIKCRPPENRDPQAEEIRACLPFLQRQLAAVQPQVICTLGNHATQTLLDTAMPVSALRGRFHTVGTIRIMPTFHPAYLLRNSEKKREVWEDMKKIMALLRIPL